MTSKEIITRLIDEKLINGEEAYVLINDIVQAELVASMKILKEGERNTNSIQWSPSVWTTYSNNNLTAIDSSGTTYSGQ